MHQNLKSNQPTKKREESNETFLYHLKLNYLTLLVSQLLFENDALKKRVAEHYNLELPVCSLESHIKYLEGNLCRSRNFLKDPIMSEMYQKKLSKNCNICDIIKNYIHKVEQLSVCQRHQKKTFLETHPSERGPSSSTASETCGTLHKAPHVFSVDASTSSSNPHHENTGSLQKTSNIYPIKYVKYMEDCLLSLKRKFKKFVPVSVQYLNVSTSNMSKPSSSKSSIRTENERVIEFQSCQSTKKSNLHTSAYDTKTFNITIASSLSRKNHDNSTFHPDSHSPVLLEKQDGAKAKEKLNSAKFKAETATKKSTLQKCNSKIKVINPSSSKRKRPFSETSGINKRRKLAASTKVMSSNSEERNLSKGKNSMNKLINSAKCIGLAEISRIKKNPKMQPFVKLVDICKPANYSLFATEESHSTATMDRFLVTTNVSTECEKRIYVRTNDSVSCFETNEKMNLISESENANGMHITGKLCSNMTMEVALRSGKKTGIKPCSDKSIEVDNPKMQPFVKLIDICKPTSYSLFPPEESHSTATMNRLLVTTNVATNNSVSSLETNEEMNLISESESANRMHISGKLCSNMTMEVDLCSGKKTDIKPCLDKTMELEHCSDKSIEVEHCSDKSIEVEHCSDKSIEVEHCSDKSIEVEHCSDKSIEVEHCSDRSIEVEHCSDRSIEVEHCSDRSIQVEHCSDRSIQVEHCSDRSIQVEHCSDRSIEIEHCSDRSIEIEHCSDRSIEIEHCSDRSIEIEHCSDKSIEVEHCSDKSIEVEHCSDKSIEVEHCSHRSVEVEHGSVKPIEIEHCSNKPIEVEYCADKAMEFTGKIQRGKLDSDKIMEEELYSYKTIEVELERNDLSSVHKRNNFEKNAHDIQECLHESEEFFENNKSEKSADSVEVQDLNQIEGLETDKNSSLNYDLSFIKGHRTPSPVIRPISPEFGDAETGAIYTPKSPPTPDRFPSVIDPCTDFSPAWASYSSLLRRGPRTPPGPLPSSPEASDDEY